MNDLNISFSDWLSLSAAPCVSELCFLFVSFVTEQKAVIRAEKDKAKMAEAFLELDDNTDGL